MVTIVDHNSGVVRAMADNLKISPDDDLDADLGDEGVFLPLTGRIVYPEDDRVLRFLREGWFEYLELTMMSRLVRPGDYFVDVGAHCGLYSKLAAHRMKGAGTIVAVEPNPALHPFIRKNLGIVHVPADGAVKVGESNLIRGAVATGSDTAMLQVGDSGWTAYSTLNAAKNPHLGQSIPVATYTLESLIVDGQADRQVIVKLDTEGLEYEILEHAAALLERRTDIHLMIEFDENNLAASNRSTSALVELVEGMGYTLATFDRRTERLVPFATHEPLWGTNLVATKNLELVNGRLGDLDKVVVAETGDLLRRGEVAEQIYRNSENLRKTLDACMDMAMKIAGTTALLEGSPEVENQVATRLAGARERPEAELPSAVVDLLTDELARLAGTAQGVAKQLDSAREAVYRAKDEISQLDARLADQHRVVVSARAEIAGDNGSPGEGAMPGPANEDSEAGHALKLTEKMSDDIGMLIGAARWLAEEVSRSRRERENLPVEDANAADDDDAPSDKPGQIAELDAAVAKLESLPAADRLRSLESLASDWTGRLAGAADGVAAQAEEARAEARSLDGQLSEAQGEVRRLTEQVERQRKESERLKDEIEAGRQEIERLARELEAGREENKRLTAELVEKTRAIDSLSRLKDETTEAGQVLAAARIDLARLVAETARTPESKARDDAMALQQKVKKDLSEAAWRLSYGARLAEGLGSEAAKDPDRDEMMAELDRLRMENRDLAADIRSISALLVNAQRSHWLRLGRRVGADLAEKLDKAASVLEEAGKRGKKAPAGEAS